MRLSKNIKSEHTDRDYLRMQSILVALLNLKKARVKEFIKKTVKEVIHASIRNVLLEVINNNNSGRVIGNSVKKVNTTAVGKSLIITPDIELTWSEFQKTKEVVELSLQEQKVAYSNYLETLSRLRSETWITGQPKGPALPQTGQQFLAQEEFDNTGGDYYLMLQEDGSKIIIT